MIRLPRASQRRGKVPTPEVIADDIRRFVLTSIPSVPYLEAMLVFHRRPSSAFGAADIARALYVDEERARALLESLVSAGIVIGVGDSASRFRFGPRDDALRSLIDRLARTYDTEMIAVTHLIHDAMGKSAHRFADAFKLRKER